MHEFLYIAASIHQISMFRLFKFKLIMVEQILKL